MAPPKYSSKRGLVNGSNAHGLVKFSIRAAPLPKSLLEFILDNISILKKIQRERGNMAGGSAGDHDQDGGDDDDAEHDRSYDDSGETFRKPSVSTDQFWTALEDVCKQTGGDWDKGIVDRIWAFGPYKAGGCLLIDARKNIKTPNSYVVPFFQLIVMTLSSLPDCGEGWVERNLLKQLQTSPRILLPKLDQFTTSTITSKVDSKWPLSKDLCVMSP